MRKIGILALAGLLGACSADKPADSTAPLGPQNPPNSAVAPVPDDDVVANTEDRVMRGPDGEVYAFEPSESRDDAPMIAGCQGMSPATRPKGSNCHGIFPEQCGADRASLYKGKVADDGIRRIIVSFTPNGDVRFYHRGDALIEDLRYGRLNVLMDEDDRILEADCF